MNQRSTKGLIFILGLSICACSNETERQDASPLADVSIDVSMADVVVDQDPIADAGSALDMGSSVLEDQGMTFPAHTTGLTRHTIQHDGLERQYTIYIPESYVPTVRTPLLLNFHGNGGNVDAHLAASDFRSVADEAGVILVYPQGSVLDGESTHWNPLLPSPNNKSDADDFGFVAAMLDRLATELNVDDSRVYATGYSNGAGLVYGLACYLSERITAIAPVSGAMWVEMPGNCNATHPTSIAIFNGTQDFERPFDGFDGYLLSVDAAAEFWARQNAIDAEPMTDMFTSNGLSIERRRYSGGDGDTVVERYKVVGGQHVWFDIDVEGQSLEQLIWRFVSQYNTAGLIAE